ncbi:MAG: WD40 repeat domain-containing protein, partial [Chloroflexota bacterium]
DGSQIVSGTRGGDVIIWDVKTTHQMTRFSNPDYPISSATFSPDGTSVLAANENGIITMWDLGTGYVKPAFWMDKRNERVTNIFFEADGKSFFVSTSDGDLVLWDVEGTTVLNRIHTHGSILNMSPDRQSFLVQPPHGGLEAWDVQQGQEVHRYKGHSDRINNIVFSPDGKRIVSNSDNGELIVWNTDSAKELFRLVGHVGKINDVAFSPDGMIIASASDDRYIILWNAQTGKIIRKIYASAHFVRFSLDGYSLLSDGENNELIQWDVSSGRETRRYVDDGSIKGWDSAVFSPDEQQILAIGTEANVVLLEVATGKVIRRLHDSSYAIFSPDGNVIISEGENHDMVFSDVISGKEIRRINSSKFVFKAEYAGDVFPSQVDISPDGRRLLMGNWDDLVMRDIKTGEVIRHFYVSGSHAVFSPDGRFILTKTDDAGDIFVTAPGRDLVLLRVDSPDELIQWTLANRAVATLDCDQRAYYGMTPLCSPDEASTGTAPPTLPFIISTPSPTLTPTATTDLNRTTATITPTITPRLPSLTPTANRATLAIESSATAEAINTQHAIKNMTATVVALTPTPTFNPGGNTTVGSQHDQLEPPKWKVWRYHGTAGEVVTIRVKADKPSDNQSADVLLYPYFVLHGPNGTLLETVN